MKSKEQKNAELLLNTVAFYASNTSRRAINRSWSVHCMYRTLDGRKCAIGRFITDEEYNPEWDADQTSIAGIQIEIKNHYDIEFLLDLQSLHDSNRYWNYNERGMTFDGHEKVKSLDETYCGGLLQKNLGKNQDENC